jgi:hypothetical protein
MPLAPLDLLAGVVAPLVAGLGALDALAVDDVVLIAEKQTCFNAKST